MADVESEKIYKSRWDKTAGIVPILKMRMASVLLFWQEKTNILKSSDIWRLIAFVKKFESGHSQGPFIL